MASEGLLRASLPTENVTQGFIDGKALDQSCGGGNAQHGLGDKGSGERAAVLGRSTGGPGRFGNEGLEADNIQGRDELPERLGDRIDLLTKPRKQRALDDPARSHGVERIVSGGGGAAKFGRVNNDETTGADTSRPYFITCTE